MNKVIFILGKQGSGKNLKAYQICKDHKTEILTHLHELRGVSESTEYLIIEDVRLTLLAELKDLITSEKMIIRPTPEAKGRLITRPIIVITSSIIKKEDLRIRPHYEIIEM